MIEKVNPCHPDKVADRIAGAIVDLAYDIMCEPKIAVEVLIGHGECNILIESSVVFDYSDIEPIVTRIAGKMDINLHSVAQDEKLANNQIVEIRCGDNGIFKGMPLTDEERELGQMARKIYAMTQTDGKYIYEKDKRLIVCQSHIDSNTMREVYENELNKDKKFGIILNPLGDWTGGLDVDSGATNRKLGSDMAQSVTGGGLHGKDLSKADVSVNIYAWLKAQATKQPVELCCAIGDTYIDGKPYREIVEIASEFIKNQGGFEKFAEWGLF